MSNSDSVDGFLSLVLLGATFFIGHKTGQNRANKAHEDANRDREIEDLKKQIAYLNAKRPPEFKE